MTSLSLLPGPPNILDRTGARPSVFDARLLVACVGVLGLAEWLLTVSVPVAACCYGLLAVAVCLVPVLTPRGTDLLPVLAAIPVVRLMMLAAPTADVEPLIRLGLLGALTLVAVVMVARACPTRWQLLRLGPDGWVAQAYVTLVGVPLGLLVYLLAPPTPMSSAHAPVIVTIALLTLAAVPDELLFRGFLVPAATSVAQAAGVPLAASAYAATFIAYGSLPIIATAFVVGFVLGWLRQRTGSAIGVVAARIVVVLLVYLVLPALGG